MDTDLIRPSTLSELAAIEQETCLSIVMPTHATGRETRQDPIRLENLLGKAHALLKDRGMRRPDAESLLEPARDALGQLNFWQHQGCGLAIYLADGVTRMLRLPETVDESITLGRHFNLKPLMGSVASGEPFYVLALSDERARLFQGSRRDIVEIEEGEFPLEAEQYVGVRDAEITLQHHAGPARPGGRGDWASLPAEGAPGQRHGHDEASRRLEADQLRFVQQVAKRVADYLYQDDAPLVLAADNLLTGLYRREHSRGRLLETSIPGSPEPMAAHQLRDHAWEIAAPVLRADQSALLDRFGSAVPAGRAAEGYAEVTVAAAHGRVDTLLFDPRATQLGRLNDDGASASLVDQADASAAEDPANEDLVNRAVLETLRASGQAVPLRLDADQPPQHPKAILRY